MMRGEILNECKTTFKEAWECIAIQEKLEIQVKTIEET